jgi:hypothetical protein
MVRGVMFSVALSMLLIFAVFRLQSVYLEGLPPRVTRVDIETARIAYRTGQYQTATQFAIALKAAQDPPRIVILHDCRRIDVLEQIIDVLRDQEIKRFEIEMPEGC